MGPVLSDPGLSQARAMAPFSFGNIYSRDIERNYLWLAILSLGKPHDSSCVVCEEYALASEIENTFGPLESEILIIACHINTKTYSSRANSRWELLQLIPYLFGHFHTTCCVDICYTFSE